MLPAWGEAALCAWRRSAPGRLRALVGERDRVSRRFIASALAADGFEVVPCADGFEMLDELALALPRGPLPPFDLVLADGRLPGVTGLEVLEGLLMCCVRPPAVIVACPDDAATQAAARSLGAVAVLERPLQAAELRALARAIVASPAWACA